MTLRFFFLTSLLISSAAFSSQTPSAKLTPVQQQENLQWLTKFYANPHDPAPMNEALPKYSSETGQIIHPNVALRLKGVQPKDPLLKLAQVKATSPFLRAQKWRNKASHAVIEENDMVDALTKSWIKADDVVWDLDSIPTTGQSTISLWSDDYWRTEWGGASYRYASQVQYDNYKKAIAAYDQPSEWTMADVNLDSDQLASKIIDWSPAEKYDLSVGDWSFALTNEQKDEGKKSMDSDGNVADWVGICEGWSAASIMVPRPTKSVTVVGADSVPIKWYPSDVRAMASLAWARGNTDVNFISGRCDAQTPDEYPNGRLKQQECFDTNPATFHLALGNLIGRSQQSFVMDVAFDYEVWNQPVKSYEMTYFNPLDPSKTSKDWKTVAVDYDDRFINRDRFQDPLTRGVRNGSDYDDSAIKKIVGVTTTVVYMSEADPPDHTPNSSDEFYAMTTYQYDLELTEKDGKLIPTGGEWFQNAHPDFLWVPNKDTVAHTDADQVALSYDGKQVPSKKVTNTAGEGSLEGYPLCQVLSKLVDGSSGKSYACDEKKKR